MGFAVDPLKTSYVLQPYALQLTVVSDTSKPNTTRAVYFPLLCDGTICGCVISVCDDMFMNCQYVNNRGTCYSVGILRTFTCRDRGKLRKHDVFIQSRLYPGEYLKCFTPECMYSFAKRISGACILRRANCS